MFYFFGSSEKCSQVKLEFSAAVLQELVLVVWALFDTDMVACLYVLEQ